MKYKSNFNAFQVLLLILLKLPTHVQILISNWIAHYSFFIYLVLTASNESIFFRRMIFYFFLPCHICSFPVVFSRSLWLFSVYLSISLMMVIQCFCVSVLMVAVSCVDCFVCLFFFFYFLPFMLIFHVLFNSVYLYCIPSLDNPYCMLLYNSKSQWLLSHVTAYFSGRFWWF